MEGVAWEIFETNNIHHTWYENWNLCIPHIHDIQHKRGQTFWQSVIRQTTPEYNSYKVLHTTANWLDFCWVFFRANKNVFRSYKSWSSFYPSSINQMIILTISSNRCLLSLWKHLLSTFKNCNNINTFQGV